MNETREIETPQLTGQRLLSLDVFRGITIAGMILVNNPGDGKFKYAPLGHADWNGWTATDLVFPFFLFIVGVAMSFSFDKRLAGGASRVRLFEHVVRRSIILFMLGLIMFSFPNWRLMGPYVLVVVGLFVLFRDQPPLSWPETPAVRVRKKLAAALLAIALVYWIVDFRYFQTAPQPSLNPGPPLRVPGVLQRIAVCYFFASLIVITCDAYRRAMWAALLLVGYWWIFKNVSPPAGYVPSFTGRPEGWLHDWLDMKVLGRHIYSERPEPEGILSTLPAIATTLIGVLVGHWLQTKREKRDHALGLFFVGNLLIVAGLWMNHDFPINKKIWTSSYVLLTGGAAMEFLAACYWLIDVKGFRRWAWPFMVFGTNAILVYFVSGIFGRMISFYKLHPADGQEISLRNWIYQNWFHPQTAWLPSRIERCLNEPVNASLMFAVAYVLLWLLLLIPFYRKRIFLKI